MAISLETADAEDVPEILSLRAAVARKLTSDHGEGPWSHVSTEKGVLFEMRHSKLFVAHEGEHLVATFRLATKKPWAIDPDYFSRCRRPLYLLSMAVSPDRQRQGVGRRCLAAIEEICRKDGADAIRLDAYDALAGARDFYARCGFRDRGRTTYRGCPLAYYELIPGSAMSEKNAPKA